MDRIELRGMAFRGKHGVGDAERAEAQEFRVDIEIDADLGAASRSDELVDTVDYRLVRAAAKDVIEGGPRKLIETLAGDIAARVLAIPRVEAVSVRVAKVPPSMQPLDAAAVRIDRTRA
jgi:dihydroneopterin aldolase